MIVKLKTLAFCLIVFLGGCSLFVSESSFGESWSGHHVDELIAHWGEPEKKTVKENGEIEVLYKIFNDSCTYTFFTNEEGIITSYDYKSTFFGNL